MIGLEEYLDRRFWSLPREACVHAIKLRGRPGDRRVVWEEAEQ
jgi:hypothetical protein